MQHKLIGMRYLSILTLVLLGLTSCEPDYETNYSQDDYVYETDSIVHVDEIYSDGGTLPNWSPTFGTNDLVGTKWVIYRVREGYTTTTTSDTIEFTTDTKYTVNGVGHTFRTYNYSGITGSTNYQLNFNQLLTLGGSNYSGQVSLLFIEDGMIIGNEFHDLQNVSLVYRVWMRKI